MQDVAWQVYAWALPGIEDARRLMDRVMNTPPPAGTRGPERPFMSWYRFRLADTHVVALCTSPLSARYHALVKHLVGDAIAVTLPPEFVEYCRAQTAASAAQGQRKWRAIYDR